jgi:L-ribulose-5-phosphate 3-epimerase
MADSTAMAAFAVNTYSYTLSERATDCMRKLADRGFREFELMMYPGHLWPGEMDALARRDLRDRMRGEGLVLRTVNMPNVDLNLAAATVEMRQMTLGLLRQFIALAGDLGSHAVVLGPGKPNPLMPMPKAQMLEHFHRALRELVPLAANCGTSIVVENMPFAFLPGIAELLHALDEHGDASIGVVYDLANGHFVKEDLAASLRLCAKRLKVVHVSDTNQTLYRHDAVGLGTVDFAAVPPVLREIGFTQRPVLEIIDAQPDTSIERSVSRLRDMGWCPAAA